jgi:hypothetical protein
VLLLFALAGIASASATPPAHVFKVVYDPPRTADERLLEQLLKASELGHVMSILSTQFVLPHDITVEITRSQAGPYFDPKTKTIDFNLPFAALMIKVITSEYPKIKPYDLGVAFGSLEYFVLFHEIGHSLIDAWSLPVVGREEDAVDAFSTIVMADVVKDGKIALWGADFFNAISQGQKFGPVAFADEHSLSAQRAYSIACWVYGSSPSQYAYLAKFVPRERLVRCPGEYAKLKKAWAQLLAPHVRR